MKLQVALDGDLHHSLAILQSVRPYIDIVEIGTPLIYREGMAAARQLRQAFPDLPLLADLKIMDAGEEEATIAFEAGCDLVTVLGLAHDATVRGVLTATQRFGKQVMVDMMQVANPSARARTLLAMGCHYLCVHTAHDLQATDTTPFVNLQQLYQELGDVPLAVAGGIGLDTIDDIVALNPAIVVIGSAITKAPDSARVARAIRKRMVSQ
jgi:3-hexulose-6-phosphate synthase